MCPITLSIITSTVVAFSSSILSGAGIAAAASAATTAAGVAATGGGFIAAIGAGSAASLAASVGTGVTVGGLATVGGLPLAAGGALSAGATGAAGGVTVGAGIGGTALTGSALLAEAAALASIGQSSFEFREAKRVARGLRQDAREKAAAARIQAQVEGFQGTKEAAAENEAIAIAGAEQLGEVHALQNRGDVQLATLARQTTRVTQREQAGVAVRLEAVHADVRSAFRNIRANEAAAVRAARDPSKLGFALKLGASAIGGAI